MKLHVVIASTRPGRVGPQVADWFVAHAAADSRFDTRVVDLAEVGLPFFDEPEHPSSGQYVHEHTRAWSTVVDEADAFVFVTPEYNFGMPAVLKNALDFLSREWAYKPAAFVSYGMTSAGTRSVQMTKQVVTTLRMFPIGATVAIPLREHLSNDGVLRPSAHLDRAAATMLDELARVTPAMRSLRHADDAQEKTA